MLNATSSVVFVGVPVVSSMIVPENWIVTDVVPPDVTKLSIIINMWLLAAPNAVV